MFLDACWACHKLLLHNQFRAALRERLRAPTSAADSEAGRDFSLNPPIKVNALNFGTFAAIFEVLLTRLPALIEADFVIFDNKCNQRPRHAVSGPFDSFMMLAAVRPAPVCPDLVPHPFRPAKAVSGNYRQYFPVVGWFVRRSARGRFVSCSDRQSFKVLLSEIDAHHGASLRHTLVAWLAQKVGPAAVNP